uniref:Lipoprotein n=1 Tax=Syphacia muris TaxID=451379 RepID=A0A0N5AIS3_9BILA
MVSPIAAAYNPLQFITQQRSAAVELSEQARQQIEVVEQQKRILEGIANRMPRQYTYDDDEASWQSNLDAWLSKRRAQQLSTGGI